MIVDVGLFRVVLVFILATVVVAMSQRSVIVDVSVPGSTVLEVVAEATGVVVADMPMVVTMLGRRVGMLGFLPFALGPLSDLRHRGVSFRVGGCQDNPAERVPANRLPAVPVLMPLWWRVRCPELSRTHAERFAVAFPARGRYTERVDSVVLRFTADDAVALVAD